MLEGFESAIRDRFRVEEYSKVNKVCDLREAIQKNVRPGMTLHLGMAGPRWATAAIYELARQFRGTEPGFILESLSAHHPVCAGRVMSNRDEAEVRKECQIIKRSIFWTTSAYVGVQM